MRYPYRNTLQLWWLQPSNFRLLHFMPTTFRGDMVRSQLTAKKAGWLVTYNMNAGYQTTICWAL